MKLTIEIEDDRMAELMDALKIPYAVYKELHKRGESDPYIRIWRARNALGLSMDRRLVVSDKENIPKENPQWDVV